jgi:hypothetical protein
VRNADSAFSPRADANDANAVHEHVKRAAARLFEVRELGARGPTRHVGPRACSVLPREQADAGETVEPVPHELAVIELSLLGRPLRGHSHANPVLQIALPGASDGDKPAAAVPKTRLQRPTNRCRLDVRGGMRVAELGDAHVVLGLAAFEPAERFEETPERGRSLERADVPFQTAAGRDDVDGLVGQGPQAWVVWAITGGGARLKPIERRWLRFVHGLPARRKGQEREEGGQGAAHDIPSSHTVARGQKFV